MYNTMGWGLEYLHINVRYVYKLNKEHKQLEPRREKTGFLPMRKQRRRSASQ